MSRADGLARLVAEMRQSPAKAAVLLLGVVAALVVWGPRLAAGLVSDKGTGRSAGRSDAGGGAAPAAAAAGGFDRRLPAEIRSEFISISDQARGLRRLAMPLAWHELARDPFDAARYKAVARATERSAGFDEELEAERTLAAGLALEGVFHFPSGAVAVVQRQVLRLGDRLGDLTLAEIGDRTVLLRGRFAEYRLALDGEEERR